MKLFILFVAGLALVLCVFFSVRRTSVAGDASEASSVRLRQTEIHVASFDILKITIDLERIRSNRGVQSTEGVFLGINLVIRLVLGSIGLLRADIAALAILARGPLNRVRLHRCNLGLV